MCPTSLELEAFHDGELPAGQARRVEEHVEGCPSCANALGELSAMTSLLCSAPPPRMSPMGVARLDRRVADLPAARLRRTAALLGGVAAAILLVASPRALRVLRPAAAESAATAAATEAPAPRRAVLPAWQTIALSPGDAGSVAVDASGNEQLTDWMAAQLAPAKGGRND